MCALEDRRMVEKKSCMRVGMKDRGNRKIIIFIIIKDMHVECVSGWMVCTYLYMYYNNNCVSVMVVVFGKYESGKMNYV